jgi:hypothetical protein
MEASHSSVVIGLTRHLSLHGMTVYSEVRRSKQPISKHIIEASVAPFGAVRRSKISREWRKIDAQDTIVGRCMVSGYCGDGHKKTKLAKYRYSTAVRRIGARQRNGKANAGGRVPGLTTKNEGRWHSMVLCVREKLDADYRDEATAKGSQPHNVAPSKIIRSCVSFTESGRAIIHATLPAPDSENQQENLTRIL